MNQVSELAQKLLNFRVGDKQYLLPLDVVDEVLRYQTVTPVPTVPDIVLGVFNLRGTYVPVINLAKRLLNSELPQINNKSCILITTCKSQQSSVTVGLLVDEVSNVMDVAMAELSEAPNFGHRIAIELVQGMFRQDNKDYIVLDVDKLMNLDELLNLLDSVSEELKV